MILENPRVETSIRPQGYSPLPTLFERMSLGGDIGLSPHFFYLILRQWDKHYNYFFCRIINKLVKLKEESLWKVISTSEGNFYLRGHKIS